MKAKLCLFVLAVSLSVSAAEKLNVVFFLIDDLSHYGISAYGANRISSAEGFFKEVEFKTPRIDSLADEGLRCDYAYAYPLCEPTRIALMSGRNNIRNYHLRKSQHESDITFGDLFQRAGYNTCMVGKWKQTRGTKEDPGKDYISKFGWDEFCCFDVIMEGRRMIEPDIVVNGEVKQMTGTDPETGRRYYGPDIFNRYALDFIDRHKDEPFFLYYPMVLVHDEHTPTPDTRPKKIFDEFDIHNTCKYGFMKGDDRRYFPDMLAYMDKMVGTVIDKLDELGLSENTLVIVMGDNGTKETFHHVRADGSVFPGGKGGNKENGLHVPLLMKLPGSIPEKQVYEGLVNLTDMLPTLCEATGVEVVDKEGLDGISFWPQAIGKEKGEHRDTIYTWYNANHPSTSSEYVIEYAFNKKFKRYAPDADYPDGRFFDLRTDPLEEAGDSKVAVKKAWNKWHWSGLKLDKLSDEQKQAYDELGKVLTAKAYVPVKSLKITGVEKPLKVGDSKTLTCTVLPDTATRRGLIWVSSDSSVATIDKFGTVKATAPGKATITAYSWDDAYPLADNQSTPFKTTGIQDSVAISVIELTDNLR